MRIKTFLPVLWITVSSVVAQQKAITPQIPVDPDTKLITYRDVVNQEGSKEILFDRGMTWMRYYYLSPNSVANVMDKENGKIEGIGRLRVYYFDKDSNRRDGGIITYAIKLEFKDNKYRYTLNDFNVKSVSRFPIERWMNKKDPEYAPVDDSYLYQVDTIMHRLVNTLKEQMKPKTVKKDEW
jgi:hypothetical protein